MQGVKEITGGLPFTNLEAIEKLYKVKGVEIKLDPNMKIPFSMIHENQSCCRYVVSFLIEAYKRVLSIYLLVYLIPALIVYHKGLIKKLD